MRQENSKEQNIRHYFDLYAGLMCNYAYNYLFDFQKSEDIVQEVFSNIWNKEINFDDERSIKAYLLNSVKNACLNVIKQKDVLSHPLDIINYDIIDEEFDNYDEELLQDIEEEINKMPSQTSKVIKGIFYNNLKYQEVADQMGISINTVKTLLKNGLKALRVKYNEKVDIFLFYYIVNK